MLQQLVPAVRMTILLTVLTGLVYPGVVSALCQVFFASQAHGSLIEKKGQVIGSALIGQRFVRPEYFHPRPSAAGEGGYDPTASGGSNLGPASQKLYDRVSASVSEFRKENPAFTGAVPADAVTASASGLDPDISLENALAQVARVSESRHLEAAAVHKLVESSVQGRDMGLLGDVRVNVLRLNLALDETFSTR